MENVVINNREKSLERAKELKNSIEDYLEFSKQMRTGLDLQEEITGRKSELVKYFKATKKEWNNWEWQLRNRVFDSDFINRFLKLSDVEKNNLDFVGRQLRWAISPYYLSLIDPRDPHCPIRKQALPTIEETCDTEGCTDPMSEQTTSPAPCVTRRYPDRLIINVTNQCAVYCRHCQRRRNFGTVDNHASREDLDAALNYVQENTEIRDVLLTGGDALMYDDKTLEGLLKKLHRIPHVEIKRIGTRTPVTLPQRITSRLCGILAKYPPIYLNTQFNHPKEITKESARACSMLAEAGVIVGNQAVLLKGVNNDPNIMKKLNQELLKIRVRPYYIFQAKKVAGTSHFIADIQEGIEIMEKLRGYTSGLAVPAYIINAPEGLGKIPILPQYLLEDGNGFVRLRNWEQKEIVYPKG